VERNGVVVFSTTDTTVTSYVDSQLAEGETYRYTCVATLNGKQLDGSNQLSQSTLVVNAPTFGGIVSATVVSSSTIQVSWNPPAGTGTPTAYYKVWATLGASVDFSAAPTTTVSLGK